jgi:RHS repeat-associated protein
MKQSLPSRTRRVISAMLASAMLASSVLSGASFAAAGGAPPTGAEVTASPPGGSAVSSPTVVAEVVASRTADSCTYRLTDGSRRTEIYTEPIHYKGDTGQWEEIDPTLVPTGVFGQSRAKATELIETFGSDTETGAPVTVSSDEWSVGMELLGAHEAGLMAVGDTAVYPLAQTATQLTYETRRNGVKDTLVLASAEAPDTFSFFMSLDNLNVYTEPGTGAFALFDARTGKKAGRIEPLKVFDSAETTAGGPATCESATMRVVPAAGGAYLTYQVPRAWLDDPGRVFPVYVDPAVTFAGADETRNDTFVAKGDSAYHYADNHLDASAFATGAARRALINFNLSSIPNGSAINSALLQAYQWQNSSGGNFTMNCQPVVGSWGYNATWANSFGNGSVAIGSGGDYKAVPAGANQYVIWNMTNAVQGWFDGSMANNGFVLYANNESAVCQHSFWSAEYTAWTTRQPHLVVDYTLPTVTADALKPACRAGDTVAITLHAKSRAVTNLQAKVEGRLPSGSTALQAWFVFTSKPLGGAWVSTPVDGGYISYYPTASTAATPDAAVEPDLSACSAVTKADGRDVTFVYRIGKGHGDVQNNRLTTYDPDWQTRWQDQGQAYSVLVSTEATPSATTSASASWFAETDANGDGANDAACDTETAGRGAIALSWPADAAATGYGVYLFDGNQYQRVATTTAISWSTSGKRLYLSDSAIASMAAGYSGNPFAIGGLDLRDDPRPLYAKTAGSQWDTTPSYLLKVVPFNSAGPAQLAECATVTVALDGRTKHLFDDPRHAEADLGTLHGDSASVRLDRGDLTLAVSDLDIPGVGPDVSVARAYRSSSISNALLAAGWRFAFERNITASANRATYLDESGDAHVFAKRGGVWVAPYGDTDVLTGDSASGFTLAHKDRTRTTFDATGRLSTESDGCGNTVRYEWAPDGSSLTIRTPKDVPLLHERRITVRFAGGRATQATARVAGEADRVVTYDAQPTALTVVGLPGTNAQSTTVYRYDASHRIIAVAIPGFSPSSCGEAVWGVSYGSAGTSLTVTNDTGASTPRMPRTVNWDISAGRGSIVTASGTSTVEFDRLGRQVSATEENTAAATFEGYDVDGNSIRQVSPTGRTARSAYDGRGNELVSVDENGAVTTSVYSADLCVAETDARGASTMRSYNSATGNLLVEEKTLNDAGDRSHVECAYNADGTLAGEKKRIDASRIAETAYTDYSDSGEAQTTTIKNVELAEGVRCDLVTHTWVDGYGALKTAVDELGVTTVTRTLDAAGRELEATDASGTVTHSRYGALGEIALTWRSHPSTSTIADWDETAVDGAGNVTTETARATDGSIVSTVVHAYDAAGREIKSDDSLVPGAVVEKYDGQGNVKQSWDEGADLTSADASQRSTFNSEGEETVSTAPGATTASTVTSYTATGDIAERSDPDGATTSFDYDEGGDVTSEAEITETGLAETDYETDLDGRTTYVVNPDGTMATVQFDLAGNEIASGLGTQASSTNVVNILGWTLRTSDFDGAITRNTYDSLGHVVTADAGGLVTRTYYDGLGRVARQVNPDGSSVTYAYDWFGRQTSSVESSGSVLVRRENVAYDAAGREATASVTSPAGSSVASSSYAPDGLTRSTRVSRSGEASVTTLSDGAGSFRSVLARASGVTLDLSVTAKDSAGRTLSTSSNALPVVRTQAWTQAGRLARSVLGQATADYSYSAISGRKTDETRHLTFGGREESSDFDYDLTGRLIFARTGSLETRYGYEPQSGALLGIKRGQSATSTLSYETSGTGRLVSAGSRLYRSDSLGRRLSAGPSANPDETRYAWVGERLVGYVAPSVGATYAYDASGQRVRSAVTSAGLTTTTDYDYDGEKLMGLSARRSDGTTWTIDYLYDGSGQLFAGVYASSATSATPFLAETTDRGDVRELLDAQGAAFALYAYDSYGVPIEVASAGTARITPAVAAQIAARQPLRYASYSFDAESGLYHCSARYYDPAVAAFISKDPRRADGQESPYQYCGGEPVGRTDPSGAMFLSLHHKDEYRHARAKLVAAAKQLVKWKVRYSHGAHVQKPKRHGQMDCSGAVAWIYRKAGTWFAKRIPRPTSGSRWNTDSFVSHLSWKTKHWSRKRFAPGRRWQIGDVLVRGWSGGKMGHIVMVVRDGGSPKLFECAGSRRGKYREGARFISWPSRMRSWRPLWAGRFFDYEPRAPYGGRI